MRGGPISNTYFLQASTGGISGGKNNVPDPARWTYFAVCGSGNKDCLPITAALPFDPVKNFGTQNGVPQHFIHDHSYYYYASRVAWAFYIIALFFAVMALLGSVFALCSRLAAKMTGFTTLLCVLFQAVAAALMTAWTVQARKTFKKAGMSAKLGTYAYAFTWAAFACFVISAVLFCVGGSVDKGDSYQKSSYFGRKKSTRSARSRGSFRDSESGRQGVKDEYD